MNYRLPPRRGLTVGSDTSVAYALEQRLCEELPRRTGDLRVAYHARPRDIDTVATEAHRLAGAAAYCGQEPLARAARRLEQVAHGGSVHHVDAAWRLLIHELSALMSRYEY